MARKYKYRPISPSIKNWGGVRNLERDLQRSNTLISQREHVAYALLCMSETTLGDIMSWDAEGNITVKESSQISPTAMQSIKKINVRTTIDKDGNTRNQLELELYDKVAIVRLLAKASGLLDNPDANDKPAIIDVSVVAPEGGQ